MNTPTRLSGSNFLLDISQYFRIVVDEDSNECVVRTHSYTYEILDYETVKEVFAFHWEPHSKIKYPHVHLGFATKGHGLPIDNKSHIPSGRVAIEDIVTFLISDLGVKPLKKDWEAVINTEREAFMAKKSW